MSDRVPSRSNFWSILDKDVFKLIKEKKIAFQNEIQLCLENKYGRYDIGLSLKFLTELGSALHLEVLKEEINSSTYTFYYRKKEKWELINPILEEKRKLLRIFNPLTSNLGKWVEKVFYPRVLKNEGFIVEITTTKTYNLVKIKGDIDIIITPVPLTRSKIFIEVKNTLPPYNKEKLYKFLNYLREFDLDIIPVVLCRKIYEYPKEILKEYNGAFIEMDKILFPNKKKGISQWYNELIADVIRVIPERVIQPDIKKKFQVLKTLKKGTNFSKLPFFEDVDEDIERYGIDPLA